MNFSNKNHLLINARDVTKTVVQASIISAIGGLLFGYDIGKLLIKSKNMDHTILNHTLFYSDFQHAIYHYSEVIP